MTVRPQIVRADTLDLQDHETPSAKDHSNQPTHGDPLGLGPAAPHQDASLRHMTEERTAEHDHLVDAWSSGRSSHEGSELLDEDTDFLTDAASVHQEMRLEDQVMQQNGGALRSSEDSDMTDGDGEDNLEDDMVDKISSSPSIDDGGYSSFSLRSIGHSESSSSCDDLDPPSLHPFLPFLTFFEDHRLNGEYMQEAGEHRPTVSVENLVACISPTSTVPSVDVQTGRKENGIGSGVFSPNIAKSPNEGCLSQSSLSSFGFRVGLRLFAEQGMTLVDSDASSKRIRDRDIRTRDDESDEAAISDDLKFIDSDLEGQCLRELEDIDFEFVYALHTFVATVEGQANATKGDTMVLLDDSNSYWWLVRVVKDSSIGYLPAEHIETPTERLARLNKHRNIDLSATMLSDNPEKSKNPLKTAIRRRRNAKVVQFTTPTYFEASDVEWSDGEGDPDLGDMDLDLRDNGKQQQSNDGDEISSTEPIQAAPQGLDPRVDAPAAVAGPESTSSITSNEANAGSKREPKAALEAERPSEESSESQDSTPSKTKKGTIRNTDSFFKDDTAEPRKLSLTPNLLREDNDLNSPRQSESKDKTVSQESIDSLEKQSGSPTSEKFKDDKRRKEKKQGMLSGLFKRKEKKLKVDEAAGGIVARHGDGELTSPTGSSTSVSTVNSPRDRSPQAVRKQPSGGKLTKSPPPSGLASNITSPPISTPPSGLTSPPSGTSRPSTSSASSQPTQFTAPNDMTRSLRPSNNITNISARPQEREPLRINTGKADAEPRRDPEGGILSPITSLIPSQSSDQPKKEKLKKAKHRMELDVDSSPERNMTPPMNSRDAGRTPPPRNAPLTSLDEIHESMPGRWDSPVPSDGPARGMVSPQSTNQRQQVISPPPFAETPNHIETTARTLRNQTSESSMSPSTPTPTESTLQTPPETEPKTSTDASSRSPATNTTVPSETSELQPQYLHLAQERDLDRPTEDRAEDDADEPAWDGARLRSYLDANNNADVRDLLLIVHQASAGGDVVPVKKDHPILVELGYADHERRLEDVEARLDGLLNGFLERRRKGGGAAPHVLGAMPAPERVGKARHAVGVR